MIPWVEPEGMLFGKPVSTFPDHALKTSRRRTKFCAGEFLRCGKFVALVGLPPHVLKVVVDLHRGRCCGRSVVVVVVVGGGGRCSGTGRGRATSRSAGTGRGTSASRSTAGRRGTAGSGRRRAGRGRTAGAIGDIRGRRHGNVAHCQTIDRGRRRHRGRGADIGGAADRDVVARDVHGVGGKATASRHNHRMVRRQGGALIAVQDAH